MPDVQCVSLTGLEMWFNSRDHLPPHFHAEKKDDWEVKVMFMRQPPEIELNWGSPSGRDKKRLREAAEHYRLKLLAEWERAVCIQEPRPEE